MDSSLISEKGLSSSNRCLILLRRSGEMVSIELETICNVQQVNDKLNALCLPLQRGLYGLHVSPQDSA